MRPRHTHYSLPSFPVYSCAFLGPRKLALGGGGGASRTGVKNKIMVYEINDDMTLYQKAELLFEDVPMSMAAHVENSELICGVGSGSSEKKENENCRLLNFTGDRLELVRTKGTPLSSSTELQDSYQRVIVLSPDGTLLAVAGGYTLSLLSYSSLQPVVDTIVCDGEIYDASFTNDSPIIATERHLLAYALTYTTTSSPKLGGEKVSTSSPSALSLTLNKKVEIPHTFGNPSIFNFRAVKAHPLDPNIAYTVVNTKSKRGSGYVCKWNIDDDKWIVEKSRKVADKEITCIDISIDGRFLAYGSADLSIGIIDTKTLERCASIPKSHAFSPTFVKFNSTSTLCVSGSFDSSIQIVDVPEERSNSSWSVVVLLVIALFVAMLAIAVQMNYVSFDSRALSIYRMKLLDEIDEAIKGWRHRQ